MQLQQNHCPECNSEDIRPHTTYTVLSGEQRQVFYCAKCDTYFSETKNTPLAGLRKSLSLISLVLDALNDGLGINAACRTFHVGKNSIKRWMKRLAHKRRSFSMLCVTNSYSN